MSNNFHVNPKEERLNQMREELRERVKREFFLMEFDEIKKAVKYFKIIRKRRIGGTSDYYDLAINALERQVPERIPDDGAFGYCPSCRQIFNSELRNEYVIEYCPWCGQRLDWRMEE